MGGEAAAVGERGGGEIGARRVDRRAGLVPTVAARALVASPARRNAPFDRIEPLLSSVPSSASVRSEAADSVPLLATSARYGDGKPAALRGDDAGIGEGGCFEPHPAAAGHHRGGFVGECPPPRRASPPPATGCVRHFRCRRPPPGRTPASPASRPAAAMRAGTRRQAHRRLRREIGRTGDRGGARPRSGRRLRSGRRQASAPPARSPSARPPRRSARPRR